MKNTARYLAVFMTVALVIAVSIWGPEAMARYKDKGILDKPHIEPVSYTHLTLPTILG